MIGINSNENEILIPIIFQHYLSAISRPITGILVGDISP